MRCRDHGPLLLALLLAGSVAACAGQKRADEPSRRPTPEPAAAAAPTALPAPTPVPAAIACRTDADCATTPFPDRVTRVEDCYCPTCPRLSNAAWAQENEAAWQRVCASDWASRVRCAAPMCPRPRAPVCGTDGACRAAGPSPAPSR